MGYKFSKAEQWGLFRAHDGCCFWCREVVDWRSLTIDHIVPQSLSPEKLEKVKVHYALPADFSVDSPSNWVPSHPKCNGTKSNRVYELSPALVSAFEEAARKGVVAAKYVAHIESEKVFAQLDAILDRAMKEGKLQQEHIEELIVLLSPSGSATDSSFVLSDVVGVHYSSTGEITVRVNPQAPARMGFGADPIAALTVADSSGYEAELLDQRLRGILEAAERLIRQRKPLVALQLVRDVENDKSASDKVRRIAQSLSGDCELLLQNFETAKALYEQVLSNEPSDAKLHNKLAALLRMDGSFDEALTHSLLALSLAPNEPLLNANHALILAAIKRLTDLADFVASKAAEFDSGPGALALGVIAYDAGDYESAFDYLRKASEHNEGNPEILLMLELAVLQRIQEQYFAEMPMTFRVGGQNETLVEECLGNLQGVIDMLPMEDKSEIKVSAHVARAQAYSLLGKLTEAELELDKASAMEPAAAEVLVNRARLMYRTGRGGEAKTILEANLSLLEEGRGLDLLAQLKCESGDSESGLELFRRAWNTSRFNTVTFNQAERIVELEYDLHGEHAAWNFVEQLEKDYVGAAQVLKMRAKLLHRTGRDEEALELLLKARATASFDKHWYTVDIAMAYYRCGQPWKGAEELLNVCCEQNSEFLWQQYIQFNCEIGNYYAAFYRARELRISTDRIVAGITESVELAFLEYRKDAGAARTLLAFWESKQELPTHLGLRLAVLHAEAGYPDAAITTLTKLDKAGITVEERVAVRAELARLLAPTTK